MSYAVHFKDGTLKLVNASAWEDNSERNFLDFIQYEELPPAKGAPGLVVFSAARDEVLFVETTAQDYDRESGPK